MDVGGALLALGLVGSIVSALNSPCPNLFHYDSTDQRGLWTGTVTLLSDAELHGVWIRLFFDEKLTELGVGDDFGEVVASSDSTSYLIKNREFLLEAGTPTNVKITVKYDGNKAPNLIGYRLNAQMVCSAENLDSAESFPGDLDGKAFLASLTPNRKGHDEFEGCGTVPLQHGYDWRSGKGSRWPWQALIYIRKNGENRYVCGGTLVSSKHVLTAAHCVSYLKTNLALPPRLLTVRLPKGDDREVESVLVHPGYRPGSLLDDLAVVHLTKPVIINDYVRPICLRNFPDKKEEYLVGYGTNRDRKLENVAQGEVKIINEQECSEHSNLGGLLTDNVLCARYVQEEPWCVGDSGSGLASSRTGPTTLQVWDLRGVVTVGVVLQGKSVCDSSTTVLLVDVANYSKWIREAIS